MIIDSEKTIQDGVVQPDFPVVVEAGITSVFTRKIYRSCDLNTSRGSSLHIMQICPNPSTKSSSQSGSTSQRRKTGASLRMHCTCFEPSKIFYLGTSEAISFLFFPLLFVQVTSAIWLSKSHRSNSKLMGKDLTEQKLTLNLSDSHEKQVLLKDNPLCALALKVSILARTCR